MSIRTGTEEKLQKHVQARAHVLCGKAVSLVGRSSASVLYIHPTQQSPNIVVRSHFTCFSRTEHQLLSSKLISCKLSELGDVLVIISYIVVY